MEAKHLVHNLIILDESGSMDSIKDLVISGFNELVQNIKHVQEQFPNQEHFISLVSFNSGGIKELNWKDPVSKLEELNAKSYNPNNMTPLYDAMGVSINKLKNELYNTSLHNVLVTVFTDGAENASREFEGVQIKELVEDLEQHRWTFTYIGTDHDVHGAAMSISIKNVMKFEKNEKGLKEFFVKEGSARRMYSFNLSKNANVAFDFYEDDILTNKDSEEKK